MRLKRTSLKSMLTLLACALVSGQATASDTGSDSDWEWAGAIYLWTANITAVTGGGTKSEVPFYKLLDNLEFAFMGVAAARKDRWTLFADFIYLDITAEPNQTRTGPGGINDFDVDGKIDMKSLIITPQVRYEAYESGKSDVSFVAGARYLDLSMAASVDINDQPVFGVGGETDNWDFIMGLHWGYELNDKWFTTLYADVGAGDSKKTYQGMAGIGYRFNKIDMLLTYRYLQYDFDRDIPMLSEMTIKGPQLGIGFSFR